MADVKMLVSARTDVGRTRTTYEDAFAVTDLASGVVIDAGAADCAVDVRERGVLLALSDGMGGHQAGEVASALVLESLQDTLQQDGSGGMREQLEEAVLRANLTVMVAARTENRRGMGATLTAVFVRGAEAYIAEVGDSRAYLVRDGRLRQITRDQSLVQLMVDRGVLSPEEAKHSASKNVILQAVGLGADVRVAIARLELRRDDRVLLCSDGVTNEVTDAELKEILIGSGPREACETMIALANDRGGRDNQTVIVADLFGDGLEPPNEFETVTSTYVVLQAFESTLGAPAVAPAARVAPTADHLPDLPVESPAVAAPAAPAAPAAAAIPTTTTPAPPPPTAGETQQLPRRSPPSWRAGVAIAAIVVAIVIVGLVLLR